MEFWVRPLVALRSVDLRPKMRGSGSSLPVLPCTQGLGFGV